MHAIDGIPRNCQILHVEQEVVGDDTTALQCVLNSDIERCQLLEEEAQLLAKQVEYTVSSLGFFFWEFKNILILLFFLQIVYALKTGRSNSIVVVC